MRNLKLVVSVAALSAILSISAASAADLPMKAPAMVAAPVDTWTGWYVGVNGGGVWGHTNTGFRSITPTHSSIR